MWIRPYGPPTKLESDQEGGLTTDTAKIYLGRLGTELVLKGVGAHTRMLDKHIDMLRQMFLRLVTQAAEEGLPATQDHLLTCALTAKNALFTVGDTTPMQAVFGKQPAVLPNIEQCTAQLDDRTGGPDMISRGRHRFRILAVQSMVEQTAIEHTQRALATKTRPTAQHKDLQPGDQVEFNRSQQQKETSGWRGPAELVNIDTDGTHHVKYQ